MKRSYLMKNWKSNEYATAALLGGKRRRQRKYKKQGPDVNLDVANVEVKTRAVVPKWLREALAKCSEASQSQSQDKLSIIFWIQDGQPINEGLAVMSVAQARILIDAYRSMLQLAK